MSSNDPETPATSASAIQRESGYFFNPTSMIPDNSGATYHPFTAISFITFDMSDAPYDDFIGFDGYAYSVVGMLTPGQENIGQYDPWTPLGQFNTGPGCLIQTFIAACAFEYPRYTA